MKIEIVNYDWNIKRNTERKFELENTHIQDNEDILLFPMLYGG